MIFGKIKTGCWRSCVFFFFPSPSRTQHKAAQWKIDGGEYLFLLCSPAPHHASDFIRPIHVTISIIYQILARLWVLSHGLIRTLLHRYSQKQESKKKRKKKESKWMQSLWGKTNRWAIFVAPVQQIYSRKQSCRVLMTLQRAPDFEKGSFFFCILPAAAHWRHTRTHTHTHTQRAHRGDSR